MNDSANQLSRPQITHQIEHELVQENFNATNESVKSPVHFEFTEVFVWGSDNFGQLGIDS